MDKHQYELIFRCKRRELFEDVMKECCAVLDDAFALPDGYTELPIVNEQLIIICMKTGRLLREHILLEFLQTLDPSRDWMYRGKEDESELTFQERLFTRLMSVIRLTSVKYLHGYAEWVDKNYPEPQGEKDGSTTVL